MDPEIWRKHSFRKEELKTGNGLLTAEAPCTSVTVTPRPRRMRVTCELRSVPSIWSEEPQPGLGCLDHLGTRDPALRADRGDLPLLPVAFLPKVTVQDVQGHLLHTAGRGATDNSAHTLTRVGEKAPGLWKRHQCADADSSPSQTPSTLRPRNETRQ